MRSSMLRRQFCRQRFAHLIVRERHLTGFLTRVVPGRNVTGTRRVGTDGFVHYALRAEVEGWVQIGDTVQ
jgi:hypothetical protein